MKVVLITGAASGLGWALAREFLRQDWHVAAAFHIKPVPDHHPRLLEVPLDVTRTHTVQSALEQIVNHWGRVDVLINNAGVTRDGPVWQLNQTDWNCVLDANLKGAFRCCRAVLSLMRTQGQGHIINIGSLAGRIGGHGQSCYAASKAGLMGLTQSLAREEGASNIQVNIVLPGILPTRMWDQLEPHQQKRLIEANALRRINDLAEVARFVAHLAAMRHVSGQCFQLDSRITSWS